MPRGLIKVQFGVYESRKDTLLVPLGLPVECTPEQAEIVATLLEAAKFPTGPWLYVGYEYVPGINKRTQTKTEALQALHGLDDKWRKK